MRSPILILQMRNHFKAATSHDRHSVKKPLYRVLWCAMLANMAVQTAFAENAEKSSLSFGGAVRAQYQYLNYNPKRNGNLEFDILRGSFSYDDGSFIGSGQIRYYRYSPRQTGGADAGEMVFLQHLWSGYRFEDKSELTVGLNSHPFGIYPYASNNFFESIAYYAGYEDTQSFGIKYSRKDGKLETQLAYYPTDGGYGWTSATPGNYLEQESARYSFHAAKGNQERNTAIARAAYHLAYGGNAQSEIGFSYLNGEIHSSINQGGNRNAAAAHYVGLFGKLGIKLQAIQYHYSLNGSPATMLIGAFGYSNSLATKGNIYMANISYALDGSIGPFRGFKIYNDYSILKKPAAGFIDSIENVTGISFGADKWLIQADFMQGRNSTYMSPVFSSGMGGGAQAINTGNRLNVNVGYYF